MKFAINNARRNKHTKVPKNFVNFSSKKNFSKMRYCTTATEQTPEPKLEQEESLSKRGLIAKAPCRPDMKYIFQAQADLYNPDTNPDGYISMLAAGNALNLKDLFAKLKEIGGSKTMPNWVADYADMKGHETFRTAIANMMEKTWVKVPVDPECIASQAGCNSVLDQLSWCLCDAGDAMMTPLPIYPAFPNDFNAKGRVSTELIDTEKENMY